MNVTINIENLNVYAAPVALEDLLEEGFEEVDACETDAEVGDEPEETARCNAEIYADADARPVFAAETASDGR